MLQLKRYISHLLMVIFALGFFAPSIASAMVCSCVEDRCSCCSGCDEHSCDEGHDHFEPDYSCGHNSILLSGVDPFVGEQRVDSRDSSWGEELLFTLNDGNVEVGAQLACACEFFDPSHHLRHLYLLYHSLRAPPVLS